MNKKLKVGLLVTAGIVVTAVAGFVGYVEMNHDRVYDEIALPDLKASDDPELIARGKYLVRGPAHCSNCHVATFEEFARADAGEELPLRGGIEFLMGPLGSMYPPNLTPDPETGIGRYSDGQLFRMLRHAVKPDGTSSIPLLMPFFNMADEDHIAIVSYLRSLDPVKHEVPDRNFTFMGRAVRTFAPPFQPMVNPTPAASAPPMEPTVERGEYLARYVANCYGCHTKSDPMTLEMIGEDWGGGAEMEPIPLPGVDPKQWVRSPNLTSHPTGVLKNFPTPEDWIKRFRAGRTVKQSPMHWGPFSRMSDEDLTAIYNYLQTIPPVDNAVGPPVFTKED
jgi:mono/diheme cytochrome c family protein